MSETITTLRARLAEATKGPFEVRTSCASPYVSHVIDRDHEDVAEVRRAEDAHLFADAVSSLPLLLDVVEKAGELDKRLFLGDDFGVWAKAAHASDESANAAAHKLRTALAALEGE